MRPMDAGIMYRGLYLQLPVPSVSMLVVDPGVGSSQRSIVLGYDGRYIVAPDNGVADAVYNSIDASRWSVYEIEYQRSGNGICPTFHGRDVYLPVSIAIHNYVNNLKMGAEDNDAISSYLRGSAYTLNPLPYYSCNRKAGNNRVIYVDGFGNCVTSCDANTVDTESAIKVKEKPIIARNTRTFSDLLPDQAGWIVNSFGLVEIVMNCRSASAVLGIGIGDTVEVV